MRIRSGWGKSDCGKSEWGVGAVLRAGCREGAVVTRMPFGPPAYERPPDCVNRTSHNGSARWTRAQHEPHRRGSGLPLGARDCCDLSAQDDNVDAAVLCPPLSCEIARDRA